LRSQKEEKNDELIHTPAEDLPTESTGTPVVKRESWFSSILSSTLTLASCPFIPFTFPFVLGRLLVEEAPLRAACDFFDFLPGTCLPLLLPGPERTPTVIRVARGLSSSSSSSSSSSRSSASLNEDEETLRFFAGLWCETSLNRDDAGDRARL
jgi:hypothetical protein